MTTMRGSIRRSAGISDELKALGRAIAKKKGIRPLQPDEERPLGYYSVNHYTGKSGFKPGATVKKTR